MRVLESPYVSMRASQVDFKAKALIFVHKDGVLIDLELSSLGFWDDDMHRLSLNLSFN